MSTTNPPGRSGLLLLGLGAGLGIILAATGLVDVKRTGGSLPPRGAAALVNGELIRNEDFARTLAGVAADRRDGVDGQQRRLVLDRLIDEELLVQRGIELGLARHDRKVRADLTAAVIASVVAETEDVEPTPTELQSFYDENRAFFTRPGRLRLRQVFIDPAKDGGDGAARTRAAEASRRVRAGEPFAVVHAALGDPEVAPLPDALLPAEKLVDYLGPTVLAKVLGLAAGEVSEPIRSGTGYHVVQIVERQPDETPPLAEIQTQVVAEFRRRAGDRALRAYLDDLRARADVVLEPDLQ
jgi:parvulin-like peptidyl-prolyl isomerase